MEIGRTPSIAPSTVASTSPSGTVRAVQTILPQYQTVNRAAGSESARLTFREVPVQDNNRQQTRDDAREQARTSSEARAREVRREIEVDRDTSALVFRSIDVSTGDVVQQYPEEARLRLSAYLETIAE